MAGAVEFEDTFVAPNATSVPEGFRQTDVGIIPKDWKLSQLYSLTREIIDGTHHTPKYTQSGVPFLRVTDVQATEIKQDAVKFVSPEEHQILRRRCNPEKGDILLSKNGTIGIPKIVNWDWEFSIFVSLALIKLKTLKIDAGYLYQFFQSDFLNKQIRQRSKQGTVTNLHLEEIREFLIPLPPTLAEQKAIAKALSDADALIESLEQLIEKKRLIKQGTMQDLLSGRQRLPGFSGEWDVQSFGEVFAFLPTATNSRADLGPGGDAYYVHYGDIHTRFHTHLNFSLVKPPTIDRERCPRAAPIKNSDWIMADASEDFDGVGKAVEVRGLTEHDVAVSGLHTFLLREKTPVFVPGFKGHLGSAEFLRKQYLRVMTGMKVYGVSKTALRDLLIPIPSAKEQAALVEVFDDVNADIAALDAKLAKARQIKQGMMQELLTGRVRLV